MGERGRGEMVLSLNSAVLNRSAFPSVDVSCRHNQEWRCLFRTSFIEPLLSNLLQTHDAKAIIEVAWQERETSKLIFLSWAEGWPGRAPPLGWREPATFWC